MKDLFKGNKKYILVRKFTLSIININNFSYFFLEKSFFYNIKIILHS